MTGSRLTIPLSLLVLTGCGEDPECRTRDDCPAGHACVGGECRPEVAPDAGVDAAMIDAAATDSTVDAGPSPDGGGVCDYVDDGVIQRSELVFEVGLGATYRVNGNAPVAVDLVGQDVGGEPLWDYTATTPSDRSVVDELLPVAGTWFAPDFPDATYAALLDEGLATLGVFRVTDQALSMLGVVSIEANRTNLSYDPPVDLMRFPIQLDDHYLVESTSSGFYNWTWTTMEETYDVTVDALGTVVVPAGSFHALRIRTNFNQHIPLTMFSVDRIIYVYVTECFGIVTRITSQDDETENLFNEAAEYRRMTL